MPPPSPTLEQFWSDGLWFVHRVSKDRRAEVYRFKVSEFDRSAFLDRRIQVNKHRLGFAVAFDKLAEGAPATAPVRGDYICHHSHVGSTLLSRIIGLAPGVQSLREPMILRWLANQESLAPIDREVAHTPDQKDSDLRVCLSLLARPIQGRERIVVKASSFANQVILDALDYQPEARILGLYGPAEDFIAGILQREELWPDMEENIANRTQRMNALVGEQVWDHSELSRGEITAMSWLAEMATMARMQKIAGARFRWLEFNSLLADMEGLLPGVAGHFDIPWGDEEFRMLRESGLLERHSKSGNAQFDAAERAARLDQARVDNAEEIARGLHLIESVRTRYPDLLTLPGE